MIPVWVMLLLVVTHIAVFLAGVYSMHLARQMGLKPTYKPFQYAQEKAKEKLADLAAEKMQRSAQFAYLDSIRRGSQEDEDGIVPVGTPKKGVK